MKLLHTPAEILLLVDIWNKFCVVTRRLLYANRSYKISLLAVIMRECYRQVGSETMNCVWNHCFQFRSPSKIHLGEL
jgi:hypothetical protein